MNLDDLKYNYLPSATYKKENDSLSNIEKDGFEVVCDGYVYQN